MWPKILLDLILTFQSANLQSDRLKVCWEVFPSSSSDRLSVTVQSESGEFWATHSLDEEGGVKPWGGSAIWYCEAAANTHQALNKQFGILRPLVQSQNTSWCFISASAAASANWWSMLQIHETFKGPTLFKMCFCFWPTLQKNVR